MPNTYFQFKQFRINQDRSAMKVCTDSCLFGSWLSHKIPAGASVLDIGSGTGLLLLMVASQKAVQAEGVEIDHEAYIQSLENISDSPWKNSCVVTETDIRNYEPVEKFDFIFSNPPFYEGSLHSPDSRKNKAMHSTDITLPSLVQQIRRLLVPGGKAAVLLPFHRLDALRMILSEEGMKTEEVVRLKQSPSHSWFRVFVLFSFDKKKHDLSTVIDPVTSGDLLPVDEKLIQTDILIKNSDGHYTPEFIAFMKPYYLHL